MDEIYIIINEENGSVLSRMVNGRLTSKVVRGSEVPHDEKGLVCTLDVLKVMGYQIERYETAILREHGPMTREGRYNLDNLKLVKIDLESGFIK